LLWSWISTRLSRVVLHRAELHARDALDLLGDLLEVGLDVVADAELVAAGAELHLRRARVLRALALVFVLDA
jgi:hypothetical protein